MAKLLPLALLCAIPLPAQGPDGSLWVSNADQQASVRSVSRVDPGGELLSTTVISPSFTPLGLGVDRFGNVWVGSTGTDVAKLDRNGNVLGIFTVGNFPQGVATDAQGNVWIASRNDDKIVRLDTNGNILSTLALPSGSGPIGLVVDPFGKVWASGFEPFAISHDLFELDGSGTLLNTYSFRTRPGFGFWMPAVARNGDIWVSNHGSNTLMRIDQGGVLRSETPAQGSPGVANGCQVDGLGFCWLANSGPEVVKVDPNGNVVASFSRPGITFTTCAIDGNGDPWIFGGTVRGSTPGVAIKLWQVDATPLVEVDLPSGHLAWGGDAGAFHLASNVDPSGDYDGDTVPNGIETSIGTNPFDARSTPATPLPIQSGVARPGSSFELTLRVRPDPNRIAVLAASLASTPPLLLPDGRSVSLAAPAIVLALLTLDGTGDARTSIAIPNRPLSGATFHVGFVTLDPAAPSGVRRIGNNLPITIR